MDFDWKERFAIETAAVILGCLAALLVAMG
jgi:hypothetical protein